jgi:anthranilate synthase component 1
MTEAPANDLLLTGTRRLVGDSITPVEAYKRLVGSGCGFIFESVDQQGQWSRYSFVGRSPLATITAKEGEISVSGSVPVSPCPGEGIYSFLSRLMAAFPIRRDSALPLASGLVGYLGYDTVREVEPSVPLTVADDTHFPDAVLYLIGDLLVFDHSLQSITLVANDFDFDSVQKRLEALEEDLAKAEAVSFPAWPKLNETEELLDQEFADRFAANVEKAKRHIVDGDIFQVVLSHRFAFLLQTDHINLYRALRMTNPSPYMYLFATEEVAVVGSSPEALVRVKDGSVLTRPIAGTRPRGSTLDADDELIEDLLNDPKERSEHLMLVDLARNDIGKVASFGTCRVAKFMFPEKFARVIHLTSVVEGQVREGIGPVDILKATIPAGTLSGAPKVRAMQIIDSLEDTKRSVYGGVVGYFSSDGDMDFAIAIRTIVVDRRSGLGYLQAGAGIVADSDPYREVNEVINKASAVAKAVIVAREL